MKPATSEGERYYILAGSFVEYIIENAGVADFMNAYGNQSANNGLIDATKKSLLDWKKEWTESLLKARKE